MSPILGIIASSISGSKASTTSYESIATTTVGSGGSSSISFTSIPSTYKHLQIRGIARSTRTDFSIDQLYTRFNSDSGSNYAWHWLSGNGSAASTDVGTSATSMNLGWFATNATASVTNAFGGLVMDVLDYADTNKYKTVRILTGNDLNGNGSPFSGTIVFASGLWRSTSAITSITFDPSSADFAQYSSFALYGIKG
jgi:hypothetical protein